MQRIRTAVEWMRGEYGTLHPLAELELETDQLNIFVRDQGHTINASKRGQVAFRDIIERYLKRIERNNNCIPIKFYPFPYQSSPKAIVMDPEVVFGRPVIVGTRITSVMVFERYTGGESLIDIAQDYDLQITAVEEAIRCEIELRAA